MILSRISESVKVLAVLTVLALLLRGWAFGNPVIHVDDQFYLVVGERILHGDLPYVDIWDRKPLGLFLIYAAAAWLFPDPVIGYQLLACLSVIGTAWLIYRMARPYAGFGSSLIGAIAYIAWLPLYGGIGGQSPVFYNLVMALAAMWTFNLVKQGKNAKPAFPGCGVMLLCGLALQIKYVTLFEGIFFGLSLLWIDWRSRRNWLTLVTHGALWIACALLPTALAWGSYAWMGHGEAFFQANFQSVFLDDGEFLSALTRLGWQMLGLVPFFVLGWIGWQHFDKVAPVWPFAWAGAALTGYLLFGNWFDHYVLPLFVPLCLIAAIGLDRVRWPKTAAALLLAIGLAAGLSRAAVDMADRGTRDEVQALASLTKKHLGNGCLYVTEDITALYHLTHSCLPSRYLFPDHLTLVRFTSALGDNQRAEMIQLLARKPSVIVFMNDPEAQYAPDTRQQLLAELARSYHAVGSMQTGAKRFTVFARISGPK